MWKMVNECIEKVVQYKGKINSKHTGILYLLKYSDELNIPVDWMENRLGLCYTTYMINCHQKTRGFDVVCKSTVNLALNKLTYIFLYIYI